MYTHTHTHINTNTLPRWNITSHTVMWSQYQRNLHRLFNNIVNEPWRYTDFKYSISIFNVNLATQLKAATKNFYFLLILAPVDKWVWARPPCVLKILAWSWSRHQLVLPWFYPHCPLLNDVVDVMLVKQMSKPRQGWLLSHVIQRFRVSSISTTTRLVLCINQPENDL